MGRYAHDEIVPEQGSELSKKEQVAKMFDHIAGRYDFLNRFLSAGIDVSWRKKALKALKPHQPQNILDVATGTADMALMASEMLNPVQITGIDISEGMLEIGREKVKKTRKDGQIQLLTGDSETINFPDNSFDAVTVAFGVRNFEHLEKGLKEIYRVLQPNGQFIVLEFSRPKTPGIAQIYNLYMGTIAPQMGDMFSGNRKAYQYLNDSVQRFPEGQDFVNILETIGFTHTSCKPLTFGICSLYQATKP
jgi:demethylmenaquinone methyltransferase / 2-methoxy-6-polyprenyl-1,4-benzoquinol methylase